MTESILINISYLHCRSRMGGWLWSQSHSGQRGGDLTDYQFCSLEVQIHTIQFALFVFLPLCMHDCLTTVHHGPFNSLDDATASLSEAVKEKQVSALRKDHGSDRLSRIRRFDFCCQLFMLYVQPLRKSPACAQGCCRHEPPPSSCIQAEPLLRVSIFLPRLHPMKA